MNKTLIVLNNNTDHLWRRYLLRTCHDSLFVDPSDITERGEIPHHNDIAGWQRWLKARQVTQVICLDPDQWSRMIISAGILDNVFLTIYLTESVSKKCYDGLRIINRWVDQYRCASRSISGQLSQFGIDPQKITVNFPNVEIIRISDTRQKELREEIGGGPVLLALPKPDHDRPLYNITWAAAILKHIYHDLRLVVSGKCGPGHKQLIANWQENLIAEGMVHLDEQNDFDALAAACDVIVAGDGTSGDVIRMLHARQADKPIVAPGAHWNNYLKDHPFATIVPKGKPREMASAIFGILQK